MKYNSTILLASVCMGLAPCVHAAAVLIDFNNATGSGSANDPTPAPGSGGLYYNNVSIPYGGGSGTSAAGNVSINGSGSPLALVNTANAASGWTLTLTKLNSAGAVGPTGAGANYDGTYPAMVGDYASTALKDSIYLNNLAELEVKFSGLDPTMSYDFLGYVARGNNAGTGTFDLTSGTLGSGGDSDPLSIHAFNDKATDTGVIDWGNIVPNASGEIVFKITAPASVSNANTTGINFISLNQVPEPGAAWLAGLGLLCLGRRRR